MAVDSINAKNDMHGRFDMHIHTTASDGALAPAEVVRRAYELGLSGLAITDHDTLAGLDEAGEAIEMLDMRLISGVELSCELLWPESDKNSSDKIAESGAAESNKIEVHILGYFVEKPGSELLERLAELQEHRLRRGSEMLRRLAAMGVELPDLAAEYQNGGSLGRGLIGRKLVEAGYAADVDEAFERWLSPGKSVFVPRMKLPVAEGVGLLHRNGAVAVLAHPIQLGCDAAIPAIVAAGIDGIEVSHPDHAPEDERRYRAIAAEYGLAVTGGSDYHADTSGDVLAGHSATEAELMKLLVRYRG